MPEISFVCGATEHGIIAEPQPANHVIQEWYKKLPTVDQAEKTVSNSAKTVKTCMPFLDAMTLGYILPVPIDITFDVGGGGRTLSSNYRYPRDGIVSVHHDYQIKGHPKEGQTVVKILTLWAIHTPPGWSCLIVPPLNRPGLPLEPVAGVIDTDTLRTYIVIPCFINLADGLHDIPRGTPLAQVIPFERRETELVVRAGSEEENMIASKQVGLILADSGGYRKHIRAKDRG
jgi:hypothetical protein